MAFDKSYLLPKSPVSDLEFFIPILQKRAWRHLCLIFKVYSQKRFTSLLTPAAQALQYVCTLYIVDKICAALARNCTLHIEYLKLHIAHCALHIDYLKLHIAHCIVYIVHCTLHIAHCTAPQ